MGFAVAGFLAGFLHVLSGPDHLAAIAPYAVEGKRGAWRTGVHWGIGHAAGVVVVGILALFLRHWLPIEALSGWSERCVGLVLIGIGLWGLRTALRRHLHAHEHVHDGQRHVHIHLHGTGEPHDAPRSHVHRHAPFAVGTLHGLAGSSHVMGILPALALPSDGVAGAYLAAFGLGSVMAMGAFSSLIGWLAGRANAHGATSYRRLLGLSSIVAIAVGGFWLLPR